jgi:hypothetical protein
MRLSLPRRGVGCPVFLALVGFLGASGCKSSATISGKVYYDKVPLKGGNVAFISEDGRAFAARIDKDGSYKLEKVPTGKVKITVETESLNPGRKNRYKNEPPKGVTAPEEVKPLDAEEMAARYTWIPPKYNDPEQSDLTYEVGSGEQQKDIQLVPDPNTPQDPRRRQSEGRP